VVGGGGGEATENIVGIASMNGLTQQ